MSGEIRQVTVTVTTRDTEDLPTGVTHDDVASEVREVVERAVCEWNDFAGAGLLKCEPEVS